MNLVKIYLLIGNGDCYFCFGGDCVNKFFIGTTLVEEQFSNIKRKKGQISSRVGEDLRNYLSTFFFEQHA